MAAITSEQFHITRTTEVDATIAAMERQFSPEAIAEVDARFESNIAIIDTIDPLEREKAARAERWKDNTPGDNFMHKRWF